MVKTIKLKVLVNKYYNKNIRNVLNGKLILLGPIQNCLRKGYLAKND